MDLSRKVKQGHSWQTPASAKAWMETAQKGTVVRTMTSSGLEIMGVCG